jgi:hypothetical protein
MAKVGSGIVSNFFVVAAPFSAATTKLYHYPKVKGMKQRAKAK